MEGEGSGESTSHSDLCCPTIDEVISEDGGS